MQGGALCRGRRWRGVATQGRKIPRHSGRGRNPEVERT